MLASQETLNGRRQGMAHQPYKQQVGGSGGMRKATSFGNLVHIAAREECPDSLGARGGSVRAAIAQHEKHAFTGKRGVVTRNQDFESLRSKGTSGACH